MNFLVNNSCLSLFDAGKFQTEIGKRWAAEITSRRNSRLANRPN